MKDWMASLSDPVFLATLLSLGLKLVGALLALLIGLRVAKWLAGAGERALVRAEVESTAAIFLRKVLYVLLVVVLMLGVLQVIGIPMTSMVAVVGAAGLAIGLALKDSLSNIASGVMLVSLKPFRVGDFVDIAGTQGKVEAVSIFQTRLRGADNQTIVLPNSLITDDAIINLTPGEMRRIVLVIGIGYDDDIDAARAIAVDIMKAEPRVLPEPAADVLVYELAESSVNLGIRCHVNNADYFSTKCQLTEQIKKAFDANGISIPFPQRVVTMISGESGDGEQSRAAKSTDSAAA